MTTLAEYGIPGAWVSDRSLPVPLDWSRPDGPTIEVFVRELVDPARRREDLPLLLFLQGGPGGQGPRPLRREGWLERALRTHRVVLLDQRGTGRSTPVDGTVVQRLGSAAAGAEHLALMRADSIVADAEAVRERLYGGRRWSTLGQSYGGFLTLTYLSTAPEALAACYVTGGIPGVPARAEEVYRRTFARVRTKNLRFRRRHPGDGEVLDTVADLLAAEDVRLPDGDRLSVRRLQLLGMTLGFTPGQQRLHWLLEQALAEPGRLSEDFLQQVMVQTGSVGAPLFWALQESIYGDGEGATGWAAERELARHPDFAADARPLLLTGEMTFRWMFSELRALRPFAGAVELLATRSEWPRLYDPARLAANEVPLAAAVYHDDMFVDAELQLRTLEGVGASHVLVSNEWEHDGLSDPRVLSHLMDLVDEHGGERR